MNAPHRLIAPDLPPLWLPGALSHLSTRLLNLADADAVLGLRRQVLSSMDPDLQVVDPARGLSPAVEQAWVAKHLGPRATTLAVFDGDTLIAFACLLMADARDPDDPGHRLGLAAADWPRGAHMAACMVGEDYRGLHLQTKLLNWRSQLAEGRQRTLVMGMTACGNTYSRRNMMACGMAIRWVGEWRPGSWWHILAMDLNPEAAWADDHRHEWVDAADPRRQRELVGQGYVGVAETALHTGDARRASRLQFVPRGPLSSPARSPDGGPALGPPSSPLNEPSTKGRT